ncbi:MAG: OmpA family protein [Gammaproteobacteria bacterium]|nr:OmpA family protein [Gammaproteobacteria bacterium]
MRPRSHSIPHAVAAGLLAVGTTAAASAVEAPVLTPVTVSAEAATAVTRFEFIPLRHVFFDHDRALLDEQARRILDDAALYLRHATGVDRVIIQGHADYTAGEDYNDRLSDRRTDVVRDYLIDQGIAADLLRLGGLGEHTPIDENWTRSGRARNRRVEIYVVRHAESP